jgi:hypothetical protein
MVLSKNIYKITLREKRRMKRREEKNTVKIWLALKFYFTNGVFW